MYRLVFNTLPTWLHVRVAYQQLQFTEKLVIGSELCDDNMAVG